MASYNLVVLIGNLTRDVDLKYLQSGTAVTEIGLAVNDRRKNQNGEWIEETTFVDITLWGRQAEVAGEYLSKGRSVLIEGRLHLDQWDDKETGKKRSRLKVVAEQMTMVGGRSEGGGRPGGGGQGRGSADSGASQGGPPDDSYYDSGPMETPQDDVPF